MEKANISIFELRGTNHEIGFQLGERIKNSSALIELQKHKNNPYSKQEMEEMKRLFDQYCPGLNEELDSFAKSIGLENDQLIYYTMTYLKPGCSVLAMLPKITQNKHVMIAAIMNFLISLMIFLFAKLK